MAATCKLLLICGSLRSGSSNTAVLRTVQTMTLEGVTADMYQGLGSLPHFNPDDDEEGKPVHSAVADLRGQIKGADALLFSTPEYAGALPSSFKNLLDWTVGGRETHSKPVAWINASSLASPTGASDAYASLRKVLGYTGANIVEAACARIPIPRQAVGSDGLIHDPVLRQEIVAAVTALLGHCESGAGRSAAV